MFAPAPAPTLLDTSGALLRDPRAVGARLPEMTALLRDHFSPNTLRVLGPSDDFRADLFTADFGAMRVSSLAYNAPIELEVETSDDHVLLTTQARGEETVRSQGRVASGGVGFVVVDSSPAKVVKRFSADSQRINLRLERRALDALWQRTVEQPLAPPRVFAPFIASEPVARRWWSHLQLLLAYLESADQGSGARRASERIEESVMLFLLLEHPHDASHRLLPERSNGADRQLRTAEDFIRAHLGETLRLAEIAAAAGLPIRTLTAGFRRRHAVSPMQFIERLRLDAAHDALRRGNRSVTDVAEALGFSNHGRFAAAYGRRFGMPPSHAARGAGTEGRGGRR